MCEYEFGPIYHKLRLARAITRKEATQGVCSPQFLSRFEKGKSDIRSELFIKLLNRIFVPWSEFVFFIDNKSIDEYHYTSSLINHFYHCPNIPQLHHLANKYLNESKIHPGLADFYQLLAITVKSKIYELDPTYSLKEEEIKRVQHHLDKMETWGNFELFLLSNLAQTFPLSYLKNIYNKCLTNKSIFSLHTSLNKDIVLSNILTTINRLLLRLEQDSSLKNETVSFIELVIFDVLSYFNEKPARQAYPIEYLQFTFIRGILHLMENNKKGLSMCLKSIKTLIALEHYDALVIQMNRQVRHFNSTNISIDSLLD